MPAGEKEPESAATFDEEEYKDKLIEQDYSPDTAAMLAAKKKEKLAEAPAMVAKMIEINLGDL
jgi:hypothetical protein